MDILYRVICLAIGYVFGLFQTGYIYGRLHNIDIRDHGSGNAGTTNALRVLGKKAGAITFLGDICKAIIAGLVVRFVVAPIMDVHVNFMYILLLYTGLGVVLGHNFPFYMGFKGGKGIAATAGVIVSLGDWKLTFIMLFTFLIIFGITRYVSVGSIAILLGFFIEFVLFTRFEMTFLCFHSMYIPEAYLLVTIFTVLGIWRHKQNIVRLINGTEKKIGEKKE